MRAAVEINVKDAIRSGISRPYITILSFNPELDPCSGPQRRTNQLLSNHAAHTGPDHMQLSLLGPAQVVAELDGVLGHLRGRVSQERFIGFAHAYMHDIK